MQADFKIKPYMNRASLHKEETEQTTEKGEEADEVSSTEKGEEAEEGSSTEKREGTEEGSTTKKVISESAEIASKENVQGTTRTNEETTLAEGNTTETEEASEKTEEVTESRKTSRLESSTTTESQEVTSESAKETKETTESTTTEEESVSGYSKEEVLTETTGSETETIESSKQQSSEATNLESSSEKSHSEELRITESANEGKPSEPTKESNAKKIEETSEHRKQTGVSTQSLELSSLTEIAVGLVGFETTPCKYCHSESTVFHDTISGTMTAEHMRSEQFSSISLTDRTEVKTTFEISETEQTKGEFIHTINEIKTEEEKTQKSEKEKEIENTTLETEIEKTTVKEEAEKQEEEGPENTTVGKGESTVEHLTTGTENIPTKMKSTRETLENEQTSETKEENKENEEEQEENTTEGLKTEKTSAELSSTTEIAVGLVGFGSTPCKYCQSEIEREEIIPTTKVESKNEEVGEEEERKEEEEKEEGVEDKEEEEKEEEGEGEEEGEKAEGDKIEDEKETEESTDENETSEIEEEGEKSEEMAETTVTKELENKYEVTEAHAASITLALSSTQNGEGLEEHEGEKSVSPKEHGSTKTAPHKPVVIIVNNSDNKLKLNQTILEDIIGAPLEDVDLHYIDDDKIQNESSPLIPKNKALTLSVPHESCKKEDYINKQNCLCNIRSYIDTLLKKVKKEERIKPKENYCSEFLKLTNGLLIENSIKPVERMRRSLSYLEYLKNKTEKVEFETIEGMFENEYQLNASDTNLFCLPGETVKIPCITHAESMLQDEKEMVWSFRPLSSGEGKELLEKGAELVIHGVSVKDTGNYTCSKGNDPEKRHWHELEMITFPIYDINMNIFYKINDTCSLRTGDILYSYLPKIIGPLLCSNDNEVCSVDLQRPRCLTRADDNFFNVTVNAKISPDFVTSLHETCDINCKLRVYRNLVNVIYNNSEIIESIPVHSKIEPLHGIEFLPNIHGKEGSPVTVKPPKIMVFCPGGFGLESKRQSVCVPCPPHTFSGDDGAFCVTCPGGQYQPDSGSKSCIQCNSPVDNEMCLRMLYTDTKLFKIYVGVAFGFIVLMVIIVIVWTSGYKDDAQHVKNVYYEGSLRHRATTKRKDPDLETGVREPLLARSPKKPTPPRLPPVDF